jgi:hypothetical protein
MALVSGSGGGAAVVGGSSLIYRFTITGSDKASIDTGVDAAQAGSTDWTNGDVLEIFMYLRGDDAAVAAVTALTFNNDTGANYFRENINASNVTAAGFNSLASTAILDNCPGATATANFFNATQISIPNFTGVVGGKSGSVVGGVLTNAAASVAAYAEQIAYNSTNAITRVKIANNNGAQKLKIGSQLLVYKRTSA